MQSAILEPEPGSVVPRGTEAIFVRDYAWSGSGIPIIRCAPARAVVLKRGPPRAALVPQRLIVGRCHQNPHNSPGIHHVITVALTQHPHTLRMRRWPTCPMIAASPTPPSSVDVSADGGASWVLADLVEGPGIQGGGIGGGEALGDDDGMAWAWTKFEVPLEVRAPRRYIRKQLHPCHGGWMQL